MIGFSRKVIILCIGVFEMCDQHLNCAESLPKCFGVSSAKYKRKMRYAELPREDVERHFNKKFSFQTCSQALWSLPNPLNLFEEDHWKISEFQKFKDELNSVKSKLNDYDLQEWHEHTSITNIAGDILWKLKNEIKVEFPTQAWCKFFEMVMTFPLLPKEVKEKKALNSLHLCEAPGAFIASLNHYLKLHYPDVKWLWRATTLNPYYEGNPLSSMINDDRFLFHTFSNWVFGCDYTGNIMDCQNIEYLRKEVSSVGEISLITADGSIDCHNNPAEQENIVSQLLYFQAVAALNLLGDGGSFILKIFTIFEAQTVCLLYFLCCVFSTVHVFKPVSSKEGNSEVYVICLEYKGKKSIEPWLTKIWDILGSTQNNKAMFTKNSIPENFINQLLTCSRIFKDFQIEAVEKNISLHNEGFQVHHIKRMRYYIARYFLRHYKVFSLPDQSLEIVGSKKLKRTVALNIGPCMEEGSFHEQIGKESLHWKEKMLNIHSVLHKLEVFWRFHCRVKWFMGPSLLTKINQIKGKPVNVVYSSKFCSKHLLKVWNQFRDVMEYVPKVEENSHFGNKSISEHSEIMKEILHDNNESSEDNLTIINCESVYGNFVTSSSNDKLEKQCFINIINTLCHMKNCENLILLNYPLFTQFNVGAIYLMSCLFSKMGFINPMSGSMGVIFIRFQPSEERTLNFLKEMRDTCIKLFCDINQSILSILTVDVLCGMGIISSSDNECSERKKPNEDEVTPIDANSTFYYCITEINNIYLKHTISRLIDHLI